MNFESVVDNMSKIAELRRVAGAHVVDHRQLSNDDLKSAIIKVRPQYLHEETVRSALEKSLYREPRTDIRVLSRLILIDVLLNEYGFELIEANTEERVIATEQSILNKSNECDLVDLGCSTKDSEH